MMISFESNHGQNSGPVALTDTAVVTYMHTTLFPLFVSLSIHPFIHHPTHPSTFPSDKFSFTELTLQICCTSDLVIYPFLSTSNSEKVHSNFRVIFPEDVMCRAMMYSLKSSIPSSLVSNERNTCWA